MSDYAAPLVLAIVLLLSTVLAATTWADYLADRWLRRQRTAAAQDKAARAFLSGEWLR